jgi:hypothetical protein
MRKSKDGCNTVYFKNLLQYTAKCSILRGCSTLMRINVH